jgi:hypothetical protein
MGLSSEQSGSNFVQSAEQSRTIRELDDAVEGLSQGKLELFSVQDRVLK